MALEKNTTLGSNSRWRFERSDGDFLELPKDRGFEVMDSGLDRRYTSADRFRRDGGEIEGDGTFKKRLLTVHYANFANNDDDFRTTANNLESFFRDDKRPFHLYDDNNSIRAEVVVTKNKIKTPSGNQNIFAGGTMTLEMPNVLWESVDEFIQPGGTGGTGTGTDVGTTGNFSGIFLSDGDQFTIVNSGQFDAFPRIILTCLNDVISFSLENNTQGGGFEMESFSLNTGGVVVVNSVDGSITIDGSESSAFLVNGGFVKLLPGANVFEFASASGEVAVEVAWRINYAY